MKKHQKTRKIAQKTPVHPTEKTDGSVKIFSVPIIGTRWDRLLQKLWLQRKEMLHVATVNPEYVMEARANPRFAQVLSQCLTIADGWGIVWAAQILYGRVIDRVSGFDLVTEILQHAEGAGEKVFLLGASRGVAEEAAMHMQRQYPNVQFGWYEGARTVRVEQSEEASMTIAKINGFEPDYLLVAYGSPWQDIWIEENRPYLRARVAMGVGGVFDEWAGEVAPCPAWLDAMGGKWLWRLVHEPWRWKRIVKVYQFGLLVLYHKLID